MARLLTLSILSLMFSVGAQQKISDILTQEIATCDSIMSAAYGEDMFRKHFVLDESSTRIIYGERSTKRYGEVWSGDKIKMIFVSYRFTLPDRTYFLHRDWLFKFDDSRALVETPTMRTSPAKCTILSNADLNKIALLHLNKGLGHCFVGLADEGKIWLSINERSKMDSTHSFVTIEYSTRKALEWAGQGYKYRVKERYIFIDACTGEFIGKHKYVYIKQSSYW